MLDKIKRGIVSEKFNKFSFDQTGTSIQLKPLIKYLQDCITFQNIQTNNKITLTFLIFFLLTFLNLSKVPRYPTLKIPKFKGDKKNDYYLYTLKDDYILTNNTSIYNKLIDN